ncbi:probable septin aspE [Phialocephala subalpina]|uniref:Probable septin aspE n=1 Tax=Phialocephala subalpina TaxID=576137 RepID=A0A1L7XFY3_9HELO|nr:probable septin aspE [Phialocephala subalpina]
MVSMSASRPRTPSTSSPPSDKLAAIPESKNHPPRRSSLGLLLRRSKSGELKPSKKQQAIAQQQELERQRREAAAIPKSPPKLPDLYDGQKPTALPFGGEDRPDSVAIVSNKTGGYQGRGSIEPGRSSTMTSSIPVPPIPSNGNKNGEYIDPYARTESMTHRGRYSYASSAVSTINSPRRVRRRKDPTPFNILIIGARSSGKTSFLNFLKTSLALPPKKRGNRPTELVDDIFAPQNTKAGNFESHYLETEIDGERIGLTLWDSEGLEKNVVDLQLREMSSFLESKFEETFTEEMKVVRAPGVQDTHIHAAFLLLDPLRLDRNIAAAKSSASNGNSTNGKYNSAPRIIGGLDEDLDLQVLRTLQGKTTVVPVISKADTITTAHMTYLKKTVWDSLKKANLDPLEALGLDDFESDSPINSSRIEEQDEDEDSDKDSEGNLPIQTPEPSSSASPKSNRLSSGSVRRHKVDDDTELPYLPLSIISPDIYEPGVIGRKFPWGFADPMNAEHCDFTRLKEAVFSEWRGELREASRELWYEGWRTSRLKHRDTNTRR